MDVVWDAAGGDVLFRNVRWNGRPRLKGDLWVTAEGFNWRKGKAAVRWERVLAFDVMRVGKWKTEGGRSLYFRGADDPRMLDHDVVGAIDAVDATGYRGMNSHLIVETRRSVDVFTSTERYKRVCTVMRPAISYFAV
jgi:hypothetical protein